jgi:hypothetical protein
MIEVEPKVLVLEHHVTLEESVTSTFHIDSPSSSATFHVNGRVCDGALTLMVVLESQSGLVGVGLRAVVDLNVIHPGLS